MLNRKTVKKKFLGLVMVATLSVASLTGCGSDNKVVDNSDKKENAKVETRKRIQSLPAYIENLIESQENYKEYKRSGSDSYLVALNQNEIYNRFKKLTKAEGIEMTFHDLRHMFASIMLTKLQIPEKVVQEEGGWSTPHIMKSVYSNTFSDSRKNADSIRDEFFESLF